MESERKLSFIAEALTHCMENERLSARQLAELIGVSHPTIISLSRGTSDATFLTLRAIARYFEWGPGEVGKAAWFEPVATKKKAKKKATSPSLPSE